jgi:hypothetical protein
MKRLFAQWLAVVVTVAIPLSAAAAEPPPLESLYIVRAFFSDFLPDSYTELVDVTPAGDDVRVRVVRISVAHFACENDLVRAAEAVLPRRGIEDVVQAKPCSLEPAAVERALRAAKPKHLGELMHDATHTMVARCGGKERVFHFPYAGDADFEKLRRANARVAALWEAAYGMRAHAFAKGVSMNDASAEQQRAFELLGERLLPELRSGKYETGFAGWCSSGGCGPNYLAWRLRGYSGAPPAGYRGPRPQVVNEALYRFAKYEPPVFPQIALAARVFGMVRIQVAADPATGQVVNVQLIAGPPLLRDEVIRAARLWQFEPQSITATPIEFTVNFSPDTCPSP